MYRIIEAVSNISFGQKKSLQEAIDDADFLATKGKQYYVINNDDKVFYTTKSTQQ